MVGVNPRLEPRRLSYPLDVGSKRDQRKCDNQGRNRAVNWMFGTPIPATKDLHAEHDFFFKKK